jgi:hypothetical protein
MRDAVANIFDYYRVNTDYQPISNLSALRWYTDVIARRSVLCHSAKGLCSMVRYLCIDGASSGDPVSKAGQTVVRIPLALIRAGVKLHSLIPDTVIDLTRVLTEHGVYQNLRNLTESEIEHLVNAPDSPEIATIRCGREKIRIYVE